jgi:hypothetical protein
MLSARMPFEISDHLLNPRLSLAKALRGFEIKSLQPIVAALFHVTSVSCSKLLLFTSRYKRVLSVKAFQGVQGRFRLTLIGNKGETS